MIASWIMVSARFQSPSLLCVRYSPASVAETQVSSKAAFVLFGSSAMTGPYPLSRLGAAWRRNRHVGLLAGQKITVQDVEEAAAPIQANRSAAPDPRPAIADPKSEPRVPVPTVDSEPVSPKFAMCASLPATTTAEKVCALAPNACRWPCGDPRRPDFRFCGSPVAEKPYCERHRAMAYTAPRGHGVASGCRPRSQQAPVSASPLSGSALPIDVKGTRHADSRTAFVALSVQPAGAPNHRSVR